MKKNRSVKSKIFSLILWLTAAAVLSFMVLFVVMLRAQPVLIAVVGGAKNCKNKSGECVNPKKEPKKVNDCEEIKGAVCERKKDICCKVKTTVSRQTSSSSQTSSPEAAAPSGAADSVPSSPPTASLYTCDKLAQLRLRGECGLRNHRPPGYTIHCTGGGGIHLYCCPYGQVVNRQSGRCSKSYIISPEPAPTVDYNSPAVPNNQNNQAVRPKSWCKGNKKICFKLKTLSLTGCLSCSDKCVDDDPNDNRAACSDWNANTTSGDTVNSSYCDKIKDYPYMCDLLTNKCSPCPNGTTCKVLKGSAVGFVPLWIAVCS